MRPHLRDKPYRCYEKNVIMDRRVKPGDDGGG
jgi:hypothetical protein